MDNAFFKRHRLALICAAGVVVVGGCFLIYQASLSNQKTENEQNEPNTSETKEEKVWSATDKLLGLDMEQEYLDNLKSGKKWEHAEYENDEKAPDILGVSTEKSMIKFPVQVFVRLRPLIKQEIEGKHEEIEYNTKQIKKTKSVTLNISDTTKKVRKSAINRSGKKAETKLPLKKFKGFKHVLSAEEDNHETFKKCILPSIDNMFAGYTVCSFAYGHTGSGKTHTILGYDKDKSPGMYRLTLSYICDELKEINKRITNNDDKILISCRFAELYQGKMRDLFGNLVECHVREDDNGKINIRGPTIKDEETGQVKVQPLQPVYVGQDDINKLIDRVTESLQFRKQGSSAVHDESSRSHVFLEMELVTNELISQRKNLWDAEGELVPIGKARDDALIAIQGDKFILDPVTGQYSIKQDYKEPVELREKLEKVQVEFLKFDGVVKEYEQKIDDVMKNSNKCIAGTIVFVDLAGNEWGNDSKNIKTDNNVQARERKEINKSLLSLKECVRALHQHKSHVPYRDSKLTMVLRPHLKGINSTAIMIANISPSQQHILKTFNTLQYSQLVAKA